MRRETIIKNIKTRLATITKANGYDWEPKDRFEWLSEPLNIDSLPIMNINDTRDSYSSQASANHTHNLVIEIEIYIAAKADTAKQTRAAMRDILKAISTEDGNDVGDYLDIKDTELTVDKQERTVGRGMIEIVITYETAKWEM